MLVRLLRTGLVGLMFLSFLKLFQRLRPILFQKRRERAIREKFAIGLAAGTIVGLVVCITNALHGRAAIGARLAKLAMYSEPFTEGRDVFGEAIPGFPPQRFGP